MFQPSLPSSSSPTRSTTPIHADPRLKDTSDATVAPYLTHIVRHHGQLTLIPPENAGRLRKAKKKKSRATINEQAKSVVSFHSGTRARPTLVHSTSEVGTGSTLRSNINNTLRRVPLTEEMHIPDFPPPSFEEATSSHPRSKTTYTVRSRLADPENYHPLRVSVLNPGQDDRSDSDTSSTSSFEFVESAADQSQLDWENDRQAGLSLEERVTRELARKQELERQQCSHKTVDSHYTKRKVKHELPESYSSGKGKGKSTSGFRTMPVPQAGPSSHTNPHIKCDDDSYFQDRQASPHSKSQQNCWGRETSEDPTHGPPNIPQQTSSSGTSYIPQQDIPASSTIASSSTIPHVSNRTQDLSFHPYVSPSQEQCILLHPLPVLLQRDRGDNTSESVTNISNPTLLHKDTAALAACPSLESNSSSSGPPLYTTSASTSHPLPPPPPTRLQTRRPPPPIPRPRPLSTLNPYCDELSSSTTTRHEGGNGAGVLRRRRPPPPPPPRGHPTSHHNTEDPPQSHFVSGSGCEQGPRQDDSREVQNYASNDRQSDISASPQFDPVDGHDVTRAEVVAEMDVQIRGAQNYGSTEAQQATSTNVTPNIPPEGSTRPLVQPLQPMFTGPTDLDLLLARLDADDGSVREGLSYDALLALSDFIGPASSPTQVPSSTLFSSIPIGRVELARRRVLHDGRVKVKLSLLGISVDKCRICLAQFKPDSPAGLLRCQHAFHPQCLERWLVHNASCPLCRAAVQPSD